MRRSLTPPPLPLNPSLPPRRGLSLVTASYADPAYATVRFLKREREVMGKRETNEGCVCLSPFVDPDCRGGTRIEPMERTALYVPLASGVCVCVRQQATGLPRSGRLSRLFPPCHSHTEPRDLSSLTGRPRPPGPARPRPAPVHHHRRRPGLCRRRPGRLQRGLPGRPPDGAL